MLYQREIKGGSIRALLVMDAKLYISSGSGALATVPVDELTEDLEVRCAPVSNVRAFARMRERIHSLEENSCEKLQMGIRSLARSPLYTTSPLILAYIGDTFCHFVIEEHGNSSVEIISAGTACPWLRGFTPCSFSPDSNFIFGFHASIVSIDLYLKRLPFLEQCFHRAQVIGVCLMEDNGTNTRVVTAGADYFIQFTQIRWRNRSWSRLLSLYNPAAPTCIRSSPLFSGGCVVVVGGEKGTVTAWMVCSQGAWHPVDDTDLQVLSVALDCRFAAHSIDLKANQARFLHAVPLSVRDPSSLLVTREIIQFF
ncbi:hypothetical protein COOONC_01286 [Cooperia oncophora]